MAALPLTPSFLSLQSLPTAFPSHPFLMHTPFSKGCENSRSKSFLLLQSTEQISADDKECCFFQQPRSKVHGQYSWSWVAFWESKVSAIAPAALQNSLVRRWQRD